MTTIETAGVIAGALLVHLFVITLTERGPLFWIARLAKWGNK